MIKGLIFNALFEQNVKNRQNFAIFEAKQISNYIKIQHAGFV